MVNIDLYIRALAKCSNLRLLRVCAIVAPLIGLLACSEPPYTNVDNAELQKMHAQNVPIFDVRRAEEWRETGVIEGSELLTFVDARGRVMPDFLNRFTAAVGRDDPLILICRTGSRTSTLGRYLVEQMGYTQVFNVKNGIRGWIREGKPVRDQWGQTRKIVESGLN